MEAPDAEKELPFLALSLGTPAENSAEDSAPPPAKRLPPTSAANPDRDLKPEQNYILNLDQDAFSALQGVLSRSPNCELLFRMCDAYPELCNDDVYRYVLQERKWLDEATLYPSGSGVEETCQLPGMERYMSWWLSAELRGHWSTEKVREIAASQEGREPSTTEKELYWRCMYLPYELPREEVPTGMRYKLFHDCVANAYYAPSASTPAEEAAQEAVLHSHAAREGCAPLGASGVVQVRAAALI